MWWFEIGLLVVIWILADIAVTQRRLAGEDVSDASEKTPISRGRKIFRWFLVALIVALVATLCITFAPA